ncbi:MAG: anthranilate synthase component I [Alphaproteobacteria bacterium]
MSINPDFENFCNVYNKKESQVIWQSLIADLETPVSAMLKAAQGLPNSFLLESVEGGAFKGRYSFIGLEPDLIWRCEGNQAEINRQALNDKNAFVKVNDNNALASLRQLIKEIYINLPANLPPMSAGLVGYMTYDAIRMIEKIPCKNPDEINIPDSIFIRPTITIVFDNIENIVHIVTPVYYDEKNDAKTAYDNALSRLSKTVVKLDQKLVSHPEETTTTEIAPQSNMTLEAFKNMINKAKEYINAGDIFQVVLSQRFKIPFNKNPFGLYRALRRTNPSPFLFFLNFDDFALIGSSPEILVRLRNKKITIRPIAGTRKRGQTPQEDAFLAKDLLQDEKELAEHLMLLDLGRNDVGRASKVGTVKVTEKMIIEYYSHVMHIVSNVEGEIREGLDAVDVLMAGFPAGTVSGAPKVRAMEIIDELENIKRSFYAGTIGYISANGDMDTCIALRTSLVKNNTIYAQAGAGIVADSDPEMEYQETINKAMALIKAAKEAL